MQGVPGPNPSYSEPKRYVEPQNDELRALVTALALGVLAAGVLALATFQPVLRKILLAGVVALVLIKVIQLVKRKAEGKPLLLLEPTIAHFLEVMQKLIYRQDQRQKAITAQKCARASDHS